jgi:hypothetical protein
MPKSTKHGPPATDEQVLEIMQWIEEKREYGWPWKRLDALLGYKGNMADRILSGKRHPSQETYHGWRKRTRALNADTTDSATKSVDTKPAPRVDWQPMHANGRSGILDDLASARKSLDTAIADVERASSTSVPLLRPGLRELTVKLREARKWLEVA